MGARRSRPPARPVVLDSDVLIWYLRGDERARALFDRVPPSRRLLSAVVLMELMRGARDRSELRRLLRFGESSFARTIHASQDISRRATALVERHALAHRMKPEDALIAATALGANASLVTGNVKDYRFVSGLEVTAFRTRG